MFESVYPEGIPRQVLDDVKKHLDLPHILSFVGVRRAGKSTLMRQMINHLIRERSVPPRNILFCNLEMPVRNPVLFPGFPLSCPLGYPRE